MANPIIKAINLYYDKLNEKFMKISVRTPRNVTSDDCLIPTGGCSLTTEELSKQPLLHRGNISKVGDQSSIVEYMKKKEQNSDNNVVETYENEIENIGTNISVLSVMAEYDQKADSYGRGASIKSNKKEIKWSTFSDNDELNCRKKRLDTVPKVGDQRSIVDFIDFYPVDNIEDKKEHFEEQGPTLVKRK